MPAMSQRGSSPHTPPADGETQLVGGPFGGFNVPKPKDRWGRVQVEDTDDHDVLHVYRPKRDGTWVYDDANQISVDKRKVEHGH
jgi:hypothetical protein